MAATEGTFSTWTLQWDVQLAGFNNISIGAADAVIDEVSNVVCVYNTGFASLRLNDGTALSNNTTFTDVTGNGPADTRMASIQCQYIAVFASGASRFSVIKNGVVLFTTSQSYVAITSLAISPTGKFVAVLYSVGSIARCALYVGS